MPVTSLARKAALPIALLAAAAGVTACTSTTTQRSIRSAESAADVREELIAQRDKPHGPQDQQGPEPAGRLGVAIEGRGAQAVDDTGVERALDLRTLEALVLRRHPSLVASAHRVRALAERARAEGSLPAPEVMAEIWQIPFARPYALDRAGMIMFSVRQKIPAVGSLDQTAEATAQEAQAEAAKVAGEAIALLRDVDRTFADYREAWTRLSAHNAHRGVVDQMTAVTRARFMTGAGLSEIARTEVERTRADADVERDHGMEQQARARLNGLLSRPVDAPLGSPQDSAPESVRLAPVQVADRAEARSPEILAATRMERSAHAMAAAADREAHVPEFAVGFDTFMPVSNTPAGYGVSLSMSLPWVWGGASSRVRSTEHRVRAERASVENTRRQIRSDVTSALESVRAAERRYVVLRDAAIPAARRAVDATRASYATGGSDLLAWLDAARSLLEFDLEVASARADLDRALADLDFATGDRVPRAPLAELTNHHHGP